MTKPTPHIHLIISLGNPGDNYANTYHNIGLLCHDFLKKNLPPTAYTLIPSESFMNNSGKFVKEKIDSLDINPENLCIIHDDADIKLGEYKLSFGQSSAGHNGVASIIEKIGTKNFWRIRIGIRPEENSEKAKDFVLQKIHPDHMDEFNTVFWEIQNKLKELENKIS